MFSKKALVALLLSASLLTACGRQPGFELVDVSESDGEKKVEKKTEIVEQEFPITTQVDTSLKPGEHKVVQKGIRGQSRVTYEITYQGGKEISRKALKEEVIRKPVAAIIKVGAKESDEEDGTQQIIGYSDPISDRSSETPKIHNDEGDRDVIDKILSSKEWDSEDDQESPSQSSQTSSSGTSSESSNESSESEESSSSVAEDSSSSQSEESQESSDKEDAESSSSEEEGEESESTEESKENTDAEDTEGETDTEEVDPPSGEDEDPSGTEEE